MTHSPEDIHDTFLQALSRHSYAASVEREERERYERWREQQDLLDQAAYERERELDDLREADLEYERTCERLGPIDSEPEFDDDPWRAVPWYQDPDIVGYEVDEPDSLLPCEIRLNNRIRCQAGRRARDDQFYGRCKCHRHGYDPDRRREWRRQHRRFV